MNGQTRDSQIASPIAMIIHEMIGAYADREKGTDLREFLAGEIHNRLSETHPEAAQQMADTICSTVDAIDENYGDLLRAKAAGVSRETWIVDQLCSLAERGVLSAEAISGISEGLTSCNQALNTAIFGQAMRLPSPLAQTGFEGVHQKRIATDLVQEITTNSHLNLSVIGDSYPAVVVPPVRPTPAMDALFTSAPRSEPEKDVKKVVAVATVVAHELGLLKHAAGAGPVELTVMVDHGLSAAKAAYRVATGEIKVVDAIEELIDRGTASVKTLVEQTTTRIGEKLGAALFRAIGSVFGPAGMVIGHYAGAFAGRYVGQKVGALLATGVEKVSQKAKQVVRALADVADSARSALKESKWNPVNWF